MSAGYDQEESTYYAYFKSLDLLLVKFYYIALYQIPLRDPLVLFYPIFNQCEFFAEVALFGLFLLFLIFYVFFKNQPCRHFYIIYVGFFF